MYAAAQEATRSPVVLWFAFMLLVAIVLLIRGAASFYLKLRKTKIMAGQEDALRQLVNRYEQLAENSLDAQRRIAADVSELQTRAASIERILRSVE